MGLLRKAPAQTDESFTRRQLLEDLTMTKNALETAYANFEAVVDPDLIDSSIYELKAVQMRYRFLLRQAELLDSAT